MLHRREAFRFYYSEAAKLIGQVMTAVGVRDDSGAPNLADYVHPRCVDHAKRAVASEDEIFGGLEQDLAEREAANDRLDAVNVQLGAENATLREEISALKAAQDSTADGYIELADALWGNEAGRPVTFDVGELSTWRALRDRHVAQMAKAASLINAGRGATAAELAETQKSLERVTNDYITAEQSCQRVEGVLDQLWEDVHPGQQMADDLEPEEIGRQICEAWADLGRGQQEKDRAVEAAGEQTLDGLAELQKRVRALGSVLRGVSGVEGDALATSLLDDFGDIFLSAEHAEAEAPEPPCRNPEPVIDWSNPHDRPF